MEKQKDFKGEPFAGGLRTWKNGREKMRKIIVSEFVTLDGVMEDPGGAEQSERGGWAFQFERGPEGDKFKLDEVMAAEALLLGRVTYEGFAAAWPNMKNEFAEKMNSMPKYVVSSKLNQGKWNNTTLMKGNVEEEVSKLKATPGGDILVAGSGRLVNMLLQQNLVDELRLMAYPVILGKGKHLFNDGIARLSLHLDEARPIGAGIVIMVYHAERK
jgi:dihydrofolate reductase